MSKSFKARSLLLLAKQFIPDIQNNAAPMLENVLNDIIRETEDDLQLGESYASIIVKRKQGKCYVCVVTMSDTHQQLRMIESYSIETLVNMGINKFIEKESEL